MVVRGQDARDAAFLHEHHRVAIDEAVRFVRAGAVAAQGCVEAGATKVKGATVRMPEKPIDRPKSPAVELDVARGVAEKLDEHGVSTLDGETILVLAVGVKERERLLIGGREVFP